MKRPLAVWAAGSTILMAACTGSLTAGPPAVATATTPVRRPAPAPTSVEPQVRGGMVQGGFTVAFSEPHAEPVPLPMSAPPTGSASRQPDGAVLLVDVAGRLVGAVLAPPQSAARLLATAGRVEVVLDDTRAAYPLTLRLTVVRDLVASQRWVVVGGRRTLEVTPRAWLRSWTGLVGARAAWLEVAAEQPDAARPGMWEQLRCHAQFAPAKSVWHLEPWRPAVGYAATVAALCNPGPARDPDLPFSPSKTQVMTAP